jgi:predicted dienelactone hydrolase
MRPIEILIILTGVSYLFSLSFSSSYSNLLTSWLPFVGVLLVLIHLKIEGYRWQMIPAYVLIVLTLVSFFWFRSQDPQIRLTYLAIGWTGTLLLVGATAIEAGILYPVFQFAPLTGSYPVGTVSRHLTDIQRFDPYAPTPGTRRELMVQIWYPATKVEGLPHAKYRDGRQYDWRDAYLSLVQTRSYWDAPLVSDQARFPVLLFTGPLNRYQNTFETEELASHGFIVVGVDHPYDSDMVVFPDGRGVHSRKENTFLVFDSSEEYRKSAEEVEYDLQVRLADFLFVVDQLEVWNRAGGSDRFSGHLDLNKIGAFGHSFGGAVVSEACRKDPRLRAGINIDGWMFGEVRTKGVPKPFFFMSDCTPRPTADQLNRSKNTIDKWQFYRKVEEGYEEIERSIAQYGGSYLQVPGLEHMNFSDFSLHSRLKMRTGAGTIDVRRAHEIVNRLSLAFFQKYLLGDSQVSLRAVAAAYPEADFREIPFHTHMTTSLLEQHH